MITEVDKNTLHIFFKYNKWVPGRFSFWHWHKSSIITQRNTDTVTLVHSCDCDMTRYSYYSMTSRSKNRYNLVQSCSKMTVCKEKKIRGTSLVINLLPLYCSAWRGKRETFNPWNPAPTTMEMLLKSPGGSTVVMSVIHVWTIAFMFLRCWFLISASEWFVT